MTTARPDVLDEDRAARIARDQGESQADAPAAEQAAPASGQASSSEGSSSEGSSSAGARTSAESGGAARADRLLAAITACPTGIAHTYMAADSLEQAAERAGVRIVVETQGSSGSTAIDQSQIDDAVAVIFAADVGVNGRHRFAGKPVVRSGVKRAIDDPDELVAEALAAADDPDARLVESGAGGDEQVAARPEEPRRRRGWKWRGKGGDG